MESNKSVIRIIEKADHPNGYDAHYYLADIVTDVDGHLMARNTTNIWDAMRFNINSFNEDEIKRIEALIDFVKVCYMPRKKYRIELIPINLSY